MKTKSKLLFVALLSLFTFFSIASSDESKLKYEHEYRNGFIFYKFYEDGDCIAYQKGKSGSGLMNCRTEGTYTFDDDIITIKGLYSFNCDFMDSNDGEYEIISYTRLKKL